MDPLLAGERSKPAVRRKGGKTGVHSWETPCCITVQSRYNSDCMELFPFQNLTQVFLVTNPVSDFQKKFT
jgi:hypothetical protein